MELAHEIDIRQTIPSRSFAEGERARLIIFSNGDARNCEALGRLWFFYSSGFPTST